MRKEKSLLQTNKYLRNKKCREQMLVEQAAASARIEGVRGARKLAQSIAKRLNKSTSKRHRP